MDSKENYSYVFLRMDAKILELVHVLHFTNPMGYNFLNRSATADRLLNIIMNRAIVTTQRLSAQIVR